VEQRVKASLPIGAICLVLEEMEIIMVAREEQGQESLRPPQSKQYNSKPIFAYDEIVLLPLRSPSDSPHSPRGRVIYPPSTTSRILSVSVCAESRDLDGWIKAWYSEDVK